MIVRHISATMIRNVVLGILVLPGCRLDPGPTYLNDEPTSEQGGSAGKGYSATNIALAGSNSVAFSSEYGGSSGIGGNRSAGSGGNAGVAGARALGPYLPDGDLGAACAAVESGMVANFSPSIFDLVQGQWLSCGDVDLFCPSNDVGVEIASDGTWADLYRNGSGTLERSTDEWRHGRWSLHVDQSWPVNFGISFEASDSGLSIRGHHIAVTPDGSKIRGVGSCGGTYVRANAVTELASRVAEKRVQGVAVDPEPVLDPATSVYYGQCGGWATANVQFSSPMELEEVLVGNWIQCPSLADYTCPDATMLQLNADGTFSYLYKNTDGHLYRGRGWGRRGYWRGEQTTPIAGEAATILKLHPDGALDSLEIAPLVEGPLPSRHWTENGACLKNYVRADP